MALLELYTSSSDEEDNGPSAYRGTAIGDTPGPAWYKTHTHSSLSYPGSVSPGWDEQFECQDPKGRTFPGP